jgi:hypothetical protein
LFNPWNKSEWCWVPFLFHWVVWGNIWIPRF